MERMLLFIKQHFRFLWRAIDWINGLFFSWFFKSKMDGISLTVLEENRTKSIIYRKLSSKDICPLYGLITSQLPTDIKYFNPHDFDLKSIENQFHKPAFLMMGSFDRGKMIGYFFLRFFFNKKCFVGRLIDKEYRGKGIGLVMNDIMYETAWRMGFRCLSTISRNNIAVMRAHAKNSAMVILKELQNDYLLVEFVRSINDPGVSVHDSELE